MNDEGVNKRRTLINQVQLYSQGEQSLLKLLQCLGLFCGLGNPLCNLMELGF